MQARWVIRRRIVAVDVGISTDKWGRRMHDPRFTLDNGAVVSFVVEEDPDGGEYGICPIYSPALKPRG